MAGRFARIFIVAAIGLVLLGAGNGATQAVAASPRAVLDPSFGEDGVLRLPAEFPPTANGVATADGGLLVSSGSGVRALDGVGAGSEAFGGVGSAAALAGAPGDRFVVTDLAFDSFGRLLVLGETLFPESENPSPPLDSGGRVFQPSALRIVRLLPDDALDPTFGQGGVVETDLGLLPPRDTDGRRLGPRPAIEPTAIATDPRARIVITGGAVIRLSDDCRGRDRVAPVPQSAGFVARLEENGEPDPSFGEGGLVGGRGVAGSPLGAGGLGNPLIDPTGAITVRATSAYRCGYRNSHLGLARLTPDGPLSKGFGTGGTIYGPFRAQVETRDSAIVAMKELPRPRPEKEALRARLIRLRFPDTGLDGSFGDEGRTTVNFGRGVFTSIDSLALDRHGRILIGGRIGLDAKSSLVLLRVSKEGRWERDFGPQGRVVTPMPGLVEYGGSDMFFDPQGRLLVVRLYEGSSPTGGGGLLIARYLLS